MLIGTTRLTTSIRELVIIPLDQLFGCCALHSVVVVGDSSRGRSFWCVSA